jgi:PPOX class probable F420-dependent enzyme
MSRCGHAVTHPPHLPIDRIAIQLPLLPPSLTVCGDEGEDVSLPLSATDGTHREGTVGRGYFAPLTTVKYMLLTTFKPGNPPSSTPVRVVADDDRAYFRARNSSGASKRLREIESVEVAPSMALGLYCSGPPLGAIARPLAGKEADWAAEKLAGKYPAQNSFLSSLVSRLRGQQMVHYELRRSGAEEGLPP